MVQTLVSQKIISLKVSTWDVLTKADYLREYLHVQDGASCFSIASACGHLEVVKYLHETGVEGLLTLRDDVSHTICECIFSVMKLPKAEVP